MPRAVLGQNALKPQHFSIYCPWGSGRPKRKTSKGCTISGRNFWGGWVSPKKVPLAPGKCIFVFPARARNCFKRPRPKMGQNTTKSPFPTSGGPTEKELFPRKLRKTIPDSMVPFFSISGPLLLWGSERALRGCLLLLACSLLGC